uniref:Interleukin 4/13 n=2 Tax=Seriola TaxID=8160 RepID=A0A7G1KW32_SERQU|nr:interleukin 4/13 [Seriola quinqueradiata]
MKMMMLLLVSALALLVSPAVTSPTHHNLKRIMDLAEKYNESLTREFFVEDVQNLFDTGCGDMFFCKVHDILLKHENITKRKDEGELVRNLNVFISRKNVNCTELLKDVTPTGNQIQIPRLMELLTKCIKQRNWIGGNKR